MKIVNIWARGWWFQFLSPFSSPQIDGCIFVLGLSLVVNDFERYTAFGGQAGLAQLATHTVSVLNTVTGIYRAAPTNGAVFPYTVTCVLGCGCHWLFSLVGAYSKHKMTRLLSISSLKHSFGFIISNKTGQCNKLN